MADNLTTQSGTLSTVAASTTIATNDVGGGVHYQKMKLFDGTAGSTNGLTVNSDNTALVRPKPLLTRFSATSAGLTTATTNYTAGDQLGTILTVTSVALASGGYGYVTQATLLDKAKVLGAVDLYLFDQSVTLAADNAAASFSAADMDFCVGVVSFPAPTTNAATGFATVQTLAPIKCNATSLFGALVTRYANNFFTAATDINVKLWIEQF